MQWAGSMSTTSEHEMTTDGNYFSPFSPVPKRANTEPSLLELQQNIIGALTVKTNERTLNAWSETTQFIEGLNESLLSTRRSKSIEGHHAQHYYLIFNMFLHNTIGQIKDTVNYLGIKKITKEKEIMKNLHLSPVVNKTQVQLVVRHRFVHFFPD